MSYGKIVSYLTFTNKQLNELFNQIVSIDNEDDIIYILHGFVIND